MLSTADAFPAEARRIVNAANIAMPVPADIVCLHTFVEDYCECEPFACRVLGVAGPPVSWKYALFYGAGYFRVRFQRKRTFERGKIFMRAALARSFFYDRLVNNNEADKHGKDGE